jgi:hypothetical protein
VARGNHSSAAVPARSCEDGDRSPRDVAAEKMTGDLGEAGARVLHHPFERDAQLLDHDPVDLAHLVDREPGQGAGRNRSRVSLHATRALGPLRLELHAEPVGDPVHVVVVGDDLVRIDDRAVVNARGPKPLDVGLGDRRRGARELGRVGEQRTEPCVEVVPACGGDRLRERRIAGLPDERGAVLDDSVVAVVRGRNGYSDRLSLAPRQWRVPEHDRPVEADVRLERGAIQRMRRQDVRSVLAFRVGTHPGLNGPPFRSSFANQSF